MLSLKLLILFIVLISYIITSLVLYLIRNEYISPSYTPYVNNTLLNLLIISLNSDVSYIAIGLFILYMKDCNMVSTFCNNFT